MNITAPLPPFPFFSRLFADIAKNSFHFHSQSSTSLKRTPIPKRFSSSPSFLPPALAAHAFRPIISPPHPFFHCPNECIPQSQFRGVTFCPSDSPSSSHQSPIFSVPNLDFQSPIFKFLNYISNLVKQYSSFFKAFDLYDDIYSLLQSAYNVDCYPNNSYAEYILFPHNSSFNISPLKILQWNCHSITNKIDLLRTTVQEFDIIALSETWHNSSHFFSLNNFTIIRKDTLTRNSGGLAFAIRNTIFYKLPDRNFSIPGRLDSQTVIIRSDKNSLLIVSIDILVFHSQLTTGILCFNSTGCSRV